MNHNSTSTWSPMVSGPEEDFANFLEFSDLQLTFPTFDVNGHGHDGGAMEQEDALGIDAAMESEVGLMDYKEGQMNQHMDQDESQLHNSMDDINGSHGSADSLLDMNLRAQHFDQQQQQQQQMRNSYQISGRVPPTPSSIEMNGGLGRYYPHVDPHAQAIYGYRRHQKEQMVFTPLVSPAVTPLDTDFCMPEYTVPGEYFSPLTSPALEAQNHAAQRSVYGAVRNSDTSDTNSPVDMNVDVNPYRSSTNTAPTRKSKRKTSTSTSKNPARSVRQSPAMKPQTRKKQLSSTVIPPREVSEIIEDAQKSRLNGKLPSSNGKLPLPYSQDSSETGSISPEPLSEVLMPPPATPRPGSAGRSPYLHAKRPASQSSPLLGVNSQPATPASLMRIQKERERAANGHLHTSSLKESASIAEADMERIFENITLPEPASSIKPVLPQLDTSSTNDDQATPTTAAVRIPLTAPSSATIPANGVNFSSPRMGIAPSPGGSISSKRAEPNSTGRGNKKRNSISSSHVSPALRPRISPSIKPLLPEGAVVNAETSALLLASKSNYQNILEGTHLPGVSYPEALSTNLTSKRTSHKIAEQGRRNRINNALQEIASLLPPSCSAAPQISARDGTGSGSGGDGSTNGHRNGRAEVADATATNMMTGTAAQQSNSKASTVELAIEYIKALQSELKDVKGKLEVAEKKLEVGPEAVQGKGEQQEDTPANAKE